MTKDRIDVQQDPHFDGEREEVISDSVGKEIGIRTDNNRRENPFHVNALKKDPEMEKFNETLK